MAEDKKSIDQAIYVAQSDTNGGVMLSMKESVIPSISQLGGETPRIILDFDETVYRTPNKIIVVENPIVRSLRFGLHVEPLKTRMVIDLIGDCKVEKPIITEDNDGVFISLNCEENLVENNETVVLEATSKTKPVNIISPVQNTGAIINKVDDAEKTDEPLQKDVVLLQEENENIVPVIPVVAEDTVKEASPEDMLNSTRKKVDEETEVLVTSTDIEIDEPVDILILEPKSEALTESEDEDIAEVPPVQEIKKSEAVPPINNELVQQLELFEISYNRFEEKNEELVLFYLNDFTPPKVSAIEEGKLQVVCEFDQVDLSEHVEKFVKTDGEYVLSITAVEETAPQKVRVLIELSVDHDYDLQQIFYKNDNVFSLIITGQSVDTL